MKLDRFQRPPKKRPKSKKEEAEKVDPETITKVAQDQLPEILKLAGSARGQSIKLSNVPYAGDLSEKLLTHAQELETLFKDLQGAVDKNDEESMQAYLDDLKSKEEFGQKIQARTSIDFVFGELKFQQVCYGILIRFISFSCH